MENLVVAAISTLIVFTTSAKRTLEPRLPCCPLISLHTSTGFYKILAVSRTLGNLDLAREKGGQLGSLGSEVRFPDVARCDGRYILRGKL